MKPSKESVLKAVKSYPELKDYMQEQFPEYFEDKYFVFRGEEIISTSADTSRYPLMIGFGCAKIGDEFKVLIVPNRFEVEVIKNYFKNDTGLKFKIK